MQPEFAACHALHQHLLDRRGLMVVSNRGPFSILADGAQRNGGGLVTALLGLAKQSATTWIAAAGSQADRDWDRGEIPLDETGRSLHLEFVQPDAEAYRGYYEVIANPLLWFLQHNLWDFASGPVLNHVTWEAWENGYRAVNRMFAGQVVESLVRSGRPALIMLQDYHLYLAPRYIREYLTQGTYNSRLVRRGTVLTHFIHIPWPGPEDWGLLPARMREAILDGLCAVDLLGFQTREDALNFIRTCESLLPGARVNYRNSTVMYKGKTTHVRDFPISIDIASLVEQSASQEVEQFGSQIDGLITGMKLILRIDRTEPSKNIVRGFQAYDELLELHPEHRGKVVFVALLVPSRLEVDEYQSYLDRIMVAAGQVNARYGTSEWEPVRVMVGESYSRALAALQRYDVLLVNPVADGMNLVAKEGPVVNQVNGVLVLSERAGAHQQLGKHALVIAPCDISATADALHLALTMPENERSERATALKQAIERETINEWLCWQLDEVHELVTRNAVRRQA